MNKLLCAALAIGLLVACQSTSSKAKKSDGTEVKKTDSAKTEPKKTPEKTAAKTTSKTTPEKPTEKPKKSKALSQDEIKELIKNADKTVLKSFKDKYSYYLGHNLGKIIQRDKGNLDYSAYLEGLSTAYAGGKSKIILTLENREAIGKDPKKKSYMTGYIIGKNNRAFKIDLALKPYFKGLKDGKEGRNVAMSAREMKETYAKHKKIQEEKTQKILENNIKEGKKYLAENKKKKGVVETDSGLQYKVLRKGSGKSPSATDKVKVHYKGRLINGDVFNSSYARGEPDEFFLNRSMRGWREGFQLMKAGAKFEFTIPANLAFGPGGPGGGGATLIYTVELLQVGENGNVSKPISGVKPVFDEKKLKYKTTDSGLKYAVIREGKGKSPKATDKVEVYYEGTLLNGKIFDSSYQRGETTSFFLNEVIKGWTEGLQLMKEGAAFKFIIPSKIAYGVRGKGSIPPNATLIFIVELVKVK